MNDPQYRKLSNRSEIVLTMLVILMTGVGSGMFAQKQMDETTAAAVLLASNLDRQREREAANSREAHQDEIIKAEREHSAKHDRERTDHFSAFAVHAGRVQHDLGAMLEASRRANDGCTGRIARISEDYGDIGSLLEQSVGLLEAGQAEIGRLKGDNERLARIVVGWQQRYGAEHPERITVTGKMR